MVDFFIEPLSDDVWKVEADRMMDAMFDEGVLPARDRLTGGEYAIFARAPAGSLVGMAVVYQPEDTEFLWLDLLYVDPSHRRQGIGRALVDLALMRTKFLNLPALETGTLLNNKPMKRLARQCGFEEATVYFRQEVG